MTYEEQIAAHIAEVLAKMPYPRPKIAPKPIGMLALDVLKTYLLRYDICLNNENKLKSKAGHELGRHWSVEWIGDGQLIWIYQFQGRFVTKILKLGA
jgi:hypothetical protein